ncbi:MAG: uncharacterized protein KVP18_005015 [Porospora cf. gigantea A]|uniref:uncharacterized protein n=1 Tax=Porospora cf. gigantea A TaxID=2853593 RepID=UPI0035596D08|nr:MAG: hypothetical protein KVP18_005015 [Porospora cf. gigantea A]
MARKRENPQNDRPKKRAKTDPEQEYDCSDPSPLDRDWSHGLDEPKDEAAWHVAHWNVNGLRSVLKEKNGIVPLVSYVQREAPDLLFLTETKVDDSISEKFVDCIPGYKGHFECATKKGYAGVGVFVRDAIKVQVHGPAEEIEDTGRMIVVRLSDISLVCCYVPNSGRGLVNLQYRTEEWDRKVEAFLSSLDTPYVWLGDLNVAPDPIDVWSSKTNLKTAGHTPEERQSFKTQCESLQAVDAFRHLYPRRQQFTFWSTMSRAVETNHGWRLDHFVLSAALLPRLVDVVFRVHVRGSDHCPTLLVLKR